MHATSLWYRTVYITWLVASYDTHKGKRWLNSNPPNHRGQKVIYFISLFHEVHVLVYALSINTVIEKNIFRKEIENSTEIISQSVLRTDWRELQPLQYSISHAVLCSGRTYCHTQRSSKLWCFLELRKFSFCTRVIMLLCGNMTCRSQGVTWWPSDDKRVAWWPSDDTIELRGDPVLTQSNYMVTQWWHNGVAWWLSDDTIELPGDPVMTQRVAWWPSDDTDSYVVIDPVMTQRVAWWRSDHTASCVLT